MTKGIEISQQEQQAISNMFKAIEELEAACENVNVEEKEQSTRKAKEKHRQLV